MSGPERIWARGECQGFGGGWMGTWRETLHEPEPDRTEYIRIDIHDEVVKALREAVEIVHKAYVSATMEAVNAGPNHPLAKQMDTWRARCMRAETDARAALAKIGEDNS